MRRIQIFLGVWEQCPFDYPLHSVCSDDEVCVDRIVLAMEIDLVSTIAACDYFDNAFRDDVAVRDALTETVPKQVATTPNHMHGTTLWRGTVLCVAHAHQQPSIFVLDVRGGKGIAPTDNITKQVFVQALDDVESIRANRKAAAYDQRVRRGRAAVRIVLFGILLGAVCLVDGDGVRFPRGWRREVFL